VKIEVTQTLNSFWATPEEFSEMSDEEIIDLIHEDIGYFLDHATFKVVRDANNIPE